MVDSWRDRCCGVLRGGFRATTLLFKGEVESNSLQKAYLRSAWGTPGGIDAGER